MRQLFIFLIASSILFPYCSNDSDSGLVGARASDSVNGLAGSYARFLPVGAFMYVVDETNLRTISIIDPANPTQVDSKNVGESLESIFHLNGRLFIGSRSGLYIYTIDAAGIPQEASATLYNFPIEPCDPVVANDSVAYVTLSSIDPNGCGGFNQVSELRLYDVKDIRSPVLFGQYNMYNPKGLGIDGHLLFVCDDTAGLKVFDISDPYNLKLIKEYPDFIAYDVIPDNGLLIVVERDQVTQLDYSDPENIERLSSFNI